MAAVVALCTEKMSLWEKRSHISRCLVSERLENLKHATGSPKGWKGGGGVGRERENAFTSIQKVEQTALLCHQSVTFHWTNVCLTPCFDFKSRPQIHPEIRFFRAKTSIIVYLPYYMNYSENILLICKVGVMAFFRDSGQRSSHM